MSSGEPVIGAGSSSSSSAMHAPSQPQVLEGSRPILIRRATSGTRSFYVQGNASPAVNLSVHIGSVAATALQRVIADGATPDCVCALSIVHSSVLAATEQPTLPTTEVSSFTRTLLSNVVNVHLKALTGMAAVIDALERGGAAADAVQAAGVGADTVALGGVAAVGGAVIAGAPLPRVEAGLALAGLHYADGDEATDTDNDEVLPSGELAAAVFSRPVYVTRVRYESSQPSFDQWFRFRLSSLRPHTVLVVSLFDVKLPQSPVPLAVGSMPVGCCANIVNTVRRILNQAGAVQVARGSMLPSDSSMSASELPVEDTTVLRSMLQPPSVPIGILPTASYVFSWTQIPLGTPVDATAVGAVLGPAQRGAAADDAPVHVDDEEHMEVKTLQLVRARSHASIESVAHLLETAFESSFARALDVSLFVFDRGGKLLSAAAALRESVLVDEHRSRAPVPMSPLDFRDPVLGTRVSDVLGSPNPSRQRLRTASSGSDSHLPPCMRVHWRVDIDADPTAVRGALVLRSVGVDEGHPLCALPVPYLRRLGRACAPAAPRYADITSVLPVLEPLFRFMSGELERRPATGTQTGVLHSMSDARRSRMHRILENDPASDDDDAGDEANNAPTGLDERVFVGVCAHCTTLSERALQTAFRQLDANGDRLLLWEEYISYISRLLDNDLGKRAAQGTYLLVQPPARVGLSNGHPSGAGDRSLATGAPTPAHTPTVSKSASVIAKTVAAVTTRAPVAAVSDGGGDAHPCLAPNDAALSFTPAAPGLKPPSAVELQRSIEPARVVKANSDGIASIAVLTELQGYAVAYRNHTLQVLDDGLREALQLDLHSGLRLMSDVLPAELQTETALKGALFDAAADAAGEALAKQAIPLIAMDWLGEAASVLAVVCADRRIRIFELGKYISAGPQPLREVVQRRVGNEMMRQQNEYRKALQTALLADSIKHRKAGLAELLRSADAFRGGGAAAGAAVTSRQRRSLFASLVDPVSQAMRATDIDKLDAEAFVMQAVLSVNLSSFSTSYRDEDHDVNDSRLPGGHRSSRAMSTPSTRRHAKRPGSGANASSGLARLMRPATSAARQRGATGELEDIIDYGRGKDYLRLRASKATGLSLALGGTGAHSREIDIDGGDEGVSASTTQRKLRQLTFASDTTKTADPRLQAIEAASKVDGRPLRRVGGRVSSIVPVAATSFTVCRVLNDGMPTCIKLVSLRVYGRHNAGWDPALAASAISTSSTTLRPGRRAFMRSTAAGGGDAATAGSAGTGLLSSIVAAIVADNRGCISAQRVHISGALHAAESPTTFNSPITSVQLPMESVACMVTLPARSDADGTGGGGSSDGIVLSSSSATIVVGGHGGPICIVSVAMGFNRSRLLAAGGGAACGGATFRIVVTRTLQSTGPHAHPHGVTAMAYSSAERCLVTTGVDRKVLLWNVTDTARSEAQIGQLGSAGAIASERDAIVGLACNDMHNQIITVTRGGKVEMYDPRTLVCVQRVRDDDVALFTKGVAVDAIHLAVITFGSHLRLWNIREAFLNNTNAAIAVAQALAHEQRAGAQPAGDSAESPSRASKAASAWKMPQGSEMTATTALPGGASDSHHSGVDGAVATGPPALLYPVGPDDDAVTVMAATPWRTVREGYVWEAAKIPRPLPRSSETDGADEEFRKRSDSFALLTSMNKLAARAKSRASEKVRQRHEREKAQAEKAARRSSAVSQEISAIASLKEQLGGRFVRRGSVEARVISNMVEELHKHGRSENEEEDGDDDPPETASGLVSAETIATPMDGRTLLAALFSAAFNKIVAVSRDGLVRVYDLATGRMVLSFVADHVQRDEMVGIGSAQRFIPAPAAMGLTPVQLTCAALDARQRRLITGSVHGSVRVWNLSNGSLLRNLIPAPSGTEVTCVFYHPGAGLPRPIMAGLTLARVGWWLDQGRVSDDTLGQGATLAAPVQRALSGQPPAMSSRSDTGTASLILKRHREEEERLLTLHVTSGDGGTRVLSGSIGSPAALLRRRLGAGHSGPSTRSMIVDGVEQGSSPVLHSMASTQSSAGFGPASVTRQPSIKTLAASSFGSADFSALLTNNAVLPAGALKTPGAIASPKRPGIAQSPRAITAPSSSVRRATTQQQPETNATAASATVVPGQLDARVIDALTSPRYLSIEARKLISRARAEAAEEHGVNLRPLTAASPRPVLLRHPLPKRALVSGKPPLSSSPRSARATAAAALDDAFSVLDDPRMAAREEFAQAADAAAGIIAVYGGDGDRRAATARGGDRLRPASDRAGGPAMHHNAVEQEALANYQRLAPDIVHVPEADQVRPGGNASDFAFHSINQAAAAKESSGGPLEPRVSPRARTADVTVRADVVCVTGGGGQPVDDDAAKEVSLQSERVPPWALSGSTDGTMVLYNPSTQRPTSCIQLYDTDMATGALTTASIASVRDIPVMGIAVMGTQSGCIHIVDLSSAQLVRAGLPPYMRGSQQADAAIRRASFDLGVSERDAPTTDATRRFTAFVTLPASDEWNLVRRGAGPTMHVNVPWSHSTLPGAAAGTTSENGLGAGARRTSTYSLLPIVTRGITCIAVNRMGHRMCVGYEGGFARVFDSSHLQSSPWTAFSTPTVEWRPHLSKHGIAAVDLVVAGDTEYWATAGGFDVKLWTLDGRWVALFGQATSWPVALHSTTGTTDMVDAEGENTNTIIQGLGKNVRPSNVSGHAAAVEGGSMGGQPATSAGASTCLSFGWVRNASELAREQASKQGSPAPPDPSAYIRSLSRQRGGTPHAWGTPAARRLWDASSGRASASASPEAQTPGIEQRRNPVKDAPAAARATSETAPVRTTANGHDIGGPTEYERRGGAVHLAAARRYSVASMMELEGADSEPRAVTPPHSKHMRPPTADAFGVAASNIAAGVTPARPIEGVSAGRKMQVRRAASYRPASTVHHAGEPPSPIHAPRTASGSVASMSHTSENEVMDMGALDLEARNADGDCDVMNTLTDAIAEYAAEREARASSRASQIARLPEHARNPFKYMGAGKWQASRSAAGTSLS